jgi:hypothetical protein
MEKYLQKLIDDKNKELWEDLNKEFIINLDPSFEPNYLTNFKNNSITIYIYENELNPASLTHELLHILMKKNNKNVGKHLNEKITNNNSLHYIFSIPLRDHIGNCLEHNKMLPIYLSFGYDRKYFISDYTEKKMNNDLLNNLKKRYFVNKIYDREAVDFFIGKFFAMKACPNPRFDYRKYYEGLKNIDKKLFHLLNEFWEDWTTFDINDIDDDYEEILDLFVEDLTKWQSNKIVI